jgi:hypothetical protein
MKLWYLLVCSFRELDDGRHCSVHLGQRKEADSIRHSSSWPDVNSNVASGRRCRLLLSTSHEVPSGKSHKNTRKHCFCSFQNITFQRERNKDYSFRNHILSLQHYVRLWALTLGGKCKCGCLKAIGSLHLDVEEAKEGWKKLHNDVFRKLCFSPNIIWITTSRRFRWARWVAQRGEWKNRNTSLKIRRRKTSWKSQT